MAEEKKNLLTREGLEGYEQELHYLKITKREEIAQKLKEARAQGDLSENAEYDAAKDEYRALREMRSHAAFYTAGMPNSASFRREINQTQTMDEFVNKVMEIKD